jgi:hypothetical protein
MSEENCGNCYFWKQTREICGQKVGDCRRYPPGLATAGDVSDIASYPMFPFTRPDEWCGEHQTPGEDELPVWYVRTLYLCGVGIVLSMLALCLGWMR